MKSWEATFKRTRVLKEMVCPLESDKYEDYYAFGKQKESARRFISLVNSYYSCFKHHLPYNILTNNFRVTDFQQLALLFPFLYGDIEEAVNPELLWDFTY